MFRKPDWDDLGVGHKPPEEYVPPPFCMDGDGDTGGQPKPPTPPPPPPPQNEDPIGRRAQ